MAYGFIMDRVSIRLSGLNKFLPQQRSHLEAYPIEGKFTVYGVESQMSGLPNFMTWYPDRVVRKAYIDPELVIQKLAGHTANMTDEELELFIPLISKLLADNNVCHVQVYPDAFELATIIEGIPKLLVVNVFNLMEIDGNNENRFHCNRRESIN